MVVGVEDMAHRPCRSRIDRGVARVSEREGCAAVMGGTRNNRPDMSLPNFLIIGAAKAGTTSLYHYLRQHPDVFMSAVKEPRYYWQEGLAERRLEIFGREAY